MSELAKKIRHRRFTLVKEAAVECVVETNTGARFQLKIENASITGIGAVIKAPVTADDGWQVGNIVPAAKISFDGHEYALGRMVVRNVQPNGEQTTVGLSSVDGRVPVDGPMSRYLQEELGEERSPYNMELSSDKFSLANFRENNEQNVDLFGKVQKYGVFFREWEKSDRYGNKNVRLPSMGVRVQLKKKRKNSRNDYLIMGSNDYLGLAAHPDVLKSAKDAIDKYGFGSTGSPLTTGITEIHEELSLFIANMFHKEKVILFNSGYAANLGTIAGLIQNQDLVVADMIAHASIQDGMALCQGTSRFYKHNNVQHLDTLLREQRKDFAGAMVVTEGVFSMDGDVAPLDEIVRVSRSHKARIFVDEAHSLGVIGATGLGGCEKYDVIDKVDLIMGTFSKIAGGIGGFIATSEDVADWLY